MPGSFLTLAGACGGTTLGLGGVAWECLSGVSRRLRRDSLGGWVVWLGSAFLALVGACGATTLGLGGVAWECLSCVSRRLRRDNPGVGLCGLGVPHVWYCAGPPLATHPVIP